MLDFFVSARKAKTTFFPCDHYPVGCGENLLSFNELLLLFSNIKSKKTGEIFCCCCFKGIRSKGDETFFGLNGYC